MTNNENNNIFSNIAHEALKAKGTKKQQNTGIDLPLEIIDKLQLNHKGQLKAKSLVNAKELIKYQLHNTPVIKYNLFTESIEISEDAHDIGLEKGDYTDETIASVKYHLEAKYNVLFTDDLLDQAIKLIAKEYRYDPVKDFLNECHKNWDGIYRLNNFFQTFLGAENIEAVSLIAKIYFSGCVNVFFNHGAKFDYCLDLTGSQGVGKTSLLKKIAPCDYYSDQFITFTRADDLKILNTHALNNDDEMSVSSNTSFKDIKKFITTTEFEYREPYARNAKRHPKKCALARSTNDLTHLKDKTGGRRFLPIRANKNKQIKHPASEELSDWYVTQLWGEAVHYYLNGKYLQQTQEELQLLEEYRKDFERTQPLEDTVRDLLDNTFCWDDVITLDEMATELHISTRSNEMKEVEMYMTNVFGYKKLRKRVEIKDETRRNNGEQATIKRQQKTVFEKRKD